MVLQSTDAIEPCYKDLVSYALDHHQYDHTKAVLIDASDPCQSISLRDARSKVKKLVKGIAMHGIQPGDTICIHMFNHILYPILFLGIVGAGTTFTGSNPAYTVTELSHHLRISNARAIITERAHVKIVLQAAAENNIVRKNIILLEGDTEPQCCDFTTVGQLMSHGQETWTTFDDARTSTSTIAALMSTSGTTGLPKMSARSHHSWVIENQAVEDAVAKPYQVCRLLCVPFFHAFAAPLAFLSALRSGHTTYIMRRFDQAQYLDAVQRYKVTETAMPPPMIIRFLALAPQDRLMLKGVHLVFSGGAPMTADTQSTGLQMFADGARICQVWGMTEGGWFTTFKYPESDNTGSVGRLIGSYEAKIVDEHGAEVLGGTRGEILLRGPINMMGYFNDAKATRGMISKDGWMSTGDVAYEIDGKIYIVDRIKELIKVRGWQVAPGELEGCLLGHHEIVDAAVIGIAHPEEGTEVPRAYVVRRQASKLSSEQVKSHLLLSLAKYKVLACEIRFRDSIPKSASGKIMRKLLREEAQEGEAKIV